MIEMTTGARLKLQGQIASQMERMGLEPGKWNSLDLGFDLPESWPVDLNAGPKVAQLIVLAVKLKMRIIIADLDMVPGNYDRSQHGN